MDDRFADFPLTLVASWMTDGVEGDLLLCYQNLFDSETETEIKLALDDISEEIRYRKAMGAESRKNDDKHSPIKHPVFKWVKGATEVDGMVQRPASDDEASEFLAWLASVEANK